jgi:hypothetical protein
MERVEVGRQSADRGAREVSRDRMDDIDDANQG